MMTMEEIAKERASMEPLLLERFSSNKEELNNIMKFYADNPTLINKEVMEIMEKLFPLISYVIDRSDAAMALMRIGKIFDSEIILRSILEVFLKFCYIILAGDNKDVKEKLNEYYVLVPLFEKKRQSDRAKEIIAADKSLNSVFRPMVLSAEEENELVSSPEYKDRTYRKTMLAKWSFSEIMKSTSAKLSQGLIIPTEQLGYYYKMSSHLAHGDELGLRMLKEQTLKTDLHRSISELTHAIKIGRTINEVLIDITYLVHLFIGDKIAYDRAFKMSEPLVRDLALKHNALTKERDKIAGYYLAEDDNKQ